MGIAAKDALAVFLPCYLPESPVGIISPNIEARQIDLQGKAAAFCLTAQPPHMGFIYPVITGKVKQIRVGHIGKEQGIFAFRFQALALPPFLIKAFPAAVEIIF